MTWQVYEGRASLVISRLDDEVLNSIGNKDKNSRAIREK